MERFLKFDDGTKNINQTDIILTSEAAIFSLLSKSHFGYPCVEAICKQCRTKWKYVNYILIGLL